MFGRNPEKKQNYAYKTRYSNGTEKLKLFSNDDILLLATTVFLKLKEGCLLR